MRALVLSLRPLTGHPCCLLKPLQVRAGEVDELRAPRRKDLSHLEGYFGGIFEEVKLGALRMYPGALFEDSPREYESHIRTIRTE